MSPPDANEPERRAAVPERVRTSFPQISSRAWEHPADRAALVALRKIPGFDRLLRTIAGVFSERRLRLLFLAAAVRVGEEQFRTVHGLLLDGVRVLDLPEAPELYIAQDSQPNAFTIGLDRPFIVLTSGLVDLLDDDELRVVIGHELGHVLSGHALYSTVLFTLLRMSGVASWMPLGALGLRVFVHGLKEWYRKAEVSCDRAGLLVGQDPGASTRVQMKLAGGGRLGEMSLVAFLGQAEEYEASGDARDGVIRVLNLLERTHPFSVLRTLALKRWVESGDYERILAGAYPRRQDDPAASFTDEVKAAARSYRDRFTSSNDPLFTFLREVAEQAGAAGGRAAGAAADWVSRARARRHDGDGG
jgi:Zn-dependent protease with chaperone function